MLHSMSYLKCHLSNNNILCSPSSRCQTSEMALRILLVYVIMINRGCNCLTMFWKSQVFRTIKARAASKSSLTAQPLTYRCGSSKEVEQLGYKLSTILDCGDVLFLQGKLIKVYFPKRHKLIICLVLLAQVTSGLERPHFPEELFVLSFRITIWWLLVHLIFLITLINMERRSTYITWICTGSLWATRKWEYLVFQLYFPQLYALLNGRIDWWEKIFQNLISMSLYRYRPQRLLRMGVGT